MHEMSKPTQYEWTRFKRIGRYIMKYPVIVLRYDHQAPIAGIAAWTDSDFAGCKSSRNAMSGGPMMLGSHLIRSWSLTHKV